jgi:DNA primase
MLVPPTATLKLLEKATSRYEQSLEGSDASRYLENRSITKEASTYFRLGFVEDPLPGHERYLGKLAIPYITSSGVVDIRFRAVPQDGDPKKSILGPKYLSTPGAINRIFNATAISRPELFIVICEGEMDTITSHMAGIPAVGIPGAQTWKKWYWRIFRYRRVAILADNDDSGEGQRFAETVIQSIPSATVIAMPENHDVNSFVIENGIGALRKRIGLD